MPAIIIEYQQLSSGTWKIATDLSRCNGVPMKVLRNSLRDITEAFEEECVAIVDQERWKTWAQEKRN